MAALSVVSTTHRHRNTLHRRLLDFGQAQPTQGLAISFNFSGALIVKGQGWRSPAFGRAEVVNAAQAAWMRGDVSHRFGVSFASYGFVHQRLNFTQVLDATLPIEFNFEPDAERLFLAQPKHKQSVGQLALTHTSPLLLSDSAHSMGAEQPALTHTSPLLLSDSAHSMGAEQLALIHTSPLSLNDSAHAMGDDLVTVWPRWVLSPASTAHQQTATQLTLLHTSLLRQLDSSHRQWVTRISMLPPGWRFSGYVAALHELRSSTVIAEPRRVKIPSVHRG